MDSNLIVLTDQDGNSVRFELLDIVEYKEDEYAVLYPADGGDDELSPYVYDAAWRSPITRRCSRPAKPSIDWPTRCGKSPPSWPKP